MWLPLPINWKGGKEPQGLAFSHSDCWLLPSCGTSVPFSGGQESHKIDLLYHATAHFEVRKFVHNAKPEELKYDHINNNNTNQCFVKVFSERPSQENLWQVRTLTQPWGMPCSRYHMQQVWPYESLGSVM